MPRNILDWCIMMKYFEDWQYFLISLLVLVNIPYADPLIAESRDKEIFIDAVPTKPIALACVAN